MLHPFMPFLTEALWESVVDENSLVALQSWPDLSGLEDPQAEDEIGWIVDLVSQIRSVRSEMKVPESAHAALILVGGDELARARLSAAQASIGRLVRIGEISFAEEPPPQAAQLLVRGVLVALPLRDLIDVDAERARLERERERLRGDVAKIEARLSNPKFLAGAKEEAILDNRVRLEECEPLLRRLEEAIARLSP
jgi:valyl-tRNA synthetase